MPFFKTLYRYFNKCRNFATEESHLSFFQHSMSLEPPSLANMVVSKKLHPARGPCTCCVSRDFLVLGMRREDHGRLDAKNLDLVAIEIQTSSVLGSNYGALWCAKEVRYLQRWILTKIPWC